MKTAQKLSISIFLFFLTSSLFADSGSDHDDSDILLQLKPGKNIQTILNRYPTLKDEAEPFSLPNTYKLRVQDPADLDSTIAAMENDPDILWVSSNIFGETPEGVRRTLAVTDSIPTPSKYLDQDAVIRMHLSDAHTISKGAGVIIAVIDTGVDYTHPDLKDHILKDDKGNVVGKNFVTSENNDGDDPKEVANGIDDDGDCPNTNCIDEGFGHGTHVAGIIALVAPEAKILPIRVLNSDGVGTSDAVAKAIEFALDFTHHEGKVVINLSLGLPEFSPILHDELLEARKEQVPVIASGGNNNNEQMHYPATEPLDQLVISVPATDPDDVKADFSNFNTLFDVSAPGIGIYSTYPNNQFATSDGTSMAAPFVAGEIALIKALDNPENPTPVDQIEQLVQSGVDNIDAENPDFIGKLGTGRANFANALLFKGNGELKLKKAVYVNSRAKLVLHVASTLAPDAVLTVFDDATPLGIMKFISFKNYYVLKMKDVPAPTHPLTVKSSEGGTLAASVKFKD
jgi:thermitase